MSANNIRSRTTNIIPRDGAGGCSAAQGDCAPLLEAVDDDGITRRAAAPACLAAVTPMEDELEMDWRKRTLGSAGRLTWGDTRAPSAPAPEAEAGDVAAEPILVDPASEPDEDSRISLDMYPCRAPGAPCDFFHFIIRSRHVLQTTSGSVDSGRSPYASHSPIYTNVPGANQSHCDFGHS